MKTLTLKELCLILRNNIKTTLISPSLRTSEGNYILFRRYYNDDRELEFSSTLSDVHYSELLTLTNLIKTQTMTREES